MRLPAPLLFDWDEGNVEKNWKKHKVYFKEAEEVFFNTPLTIFLDQKHSFLENRFQALGVTNKRRYLSVIFTIRDKRLRIISARSQDKKERRRYGEAEKA